MIELLKKIFNYLFEMLCSKIEEAILKFKNRQLIKCVKKGKTFWIEFLLKRGADINCKDDNGKTLIQIVSDDFKSKKGEREEDFLARKKHMLNFLVNKGANLDLLGCDKTPLQYACKIGEVSLVSGLLLLGANINARNDKGETALFKACKYNNTDMVKMLLKYEANPNIPDNASEYPLHMATMNYNTEIINLLVDNNACVNLSDDYKTTPLHLACMLGNSNVVALLLYHGADVNCVDKFGKTPIHYVCEKGFYTIFPLLVSQGANAECLTNDNWAPIHYACSNNHIEMLDFLIAMNVNLNVKTSEGYTPLRIGVENGYNEIIRRLLNRNVDVNARYTKGWQVIHYAVLKNYMDTVVLLSKYGAKLDEKTYDDFTPCKIAKQGHNDDMLDFLEAQLAKQKNATTSVVLNNVNVFYNIFKVFDLFKVANKPPQLPPPKKVIKITRMSGPIPWDVFCSVIIFVATFGRHFC